ncbi:MAG TPA: arylsulfatase, partial [Limnochordia bacterium]|nr:arylsulfatase [Limnochordia bacterium]
MSKPNIVFILADDLGYGDLSCYGAVTHTTPNCDRLAAAGVRFTDAHAPSAVCTPSRYGILTGRYCWRGSLKRGVLGGTSEPLIERERPTVASFLRDQGYVTACIGKWHLGLGWARAGEAFDFAAPLNQGPLDHGFDQYFGIAASLDMPPYVFIENDRTLGVPDRPKEPLDFSQKHRGGTMVEGWRDDLVNRRHTERAVEFIASQRDALAPFFLYLATTGPHTPWSPAPEFAGKSGIGPRGDMILEFDWTVGRIMDALAENGLADDTLLIVTSDNGPHPFIEEITRHGHKPAADLRGEKADIWDGGHRVPLI